MENLSRMTIDDSSCSMYFSFNSTATYKTNLESANDNSMAIEDEEHDQNNTLGADETNQPMEEIQTIKKLSLGCSPAKAIPKNILKAYNVLSSTPTKAQLLRSVEVNRGSAAVNVDDLGLAFLEAPQEYINAVSPDDKENQPQESLEIICSETSSEIVVSVIEKAPEEEKPIKKVGFSNLPVLKNSGNVIARGLTPKVRRSIPINEPDLATNRPSRISKRVSMAQNTRNYSTSDSNSDEIPKMLNSILKISKGLPPKRKSIGNVDNPFSFLGKATRMSIVKTTLNSPARKASRKSIASVQASKMSSRLSSLPINKAKTNAAQPTGSSSSNRSANPTNIRKSMLPPTANSPKKIASLNSRKSMVNPTSSSSSWMQNQRKSISSKSWTSSLDPTKNKITLLKPQSGSNEGLICEVCSRKFLVLSLFESHKKTHNTGPSSSSSLLTKQNFSSGNNKCRYCDKKFAISKALENHLIQNCTKIPPGDKKKLLFPNLQPVANNSKAKLPPKSLSNLSSCDSLSNAAQTSRSQSNVTDGNTTMVPPLSNHKLKKKLAHSGVYCTPNKQIVCHICKTSFSNILAFTEHKLSHSNAASEEKTSTNTKTEENSDDKSEQQNSDEGCHSLK